MAVHLLRAGYRSATGRISARLAATQAARGANENPRTVRRVPSSSRSAVASAAQVVGDPPLGGSPLRSLSLRSQFAQALRQVTDEISAALIEGREVLRADRRAGKSARSQQAESGLSGSGLSGAGSPEPQPAEPRSPKPYS